MNQKKSIINSIVLLRGIAALGVCFVHIQMLSNFHANKIIDYIINNGQQGVAVFFVISGFILPYSLYKKQYKVRNFFSFLLKRSIRVDPPYWFSIILIFALTSLPLSVISFKTILLHFAYLVPFFKNIHWYSDVYWTLSIEFQYYILLGLCYPFLSKIGSLASIILLIIISVLCIKFTYRGIILANFFQFAFGYIAFVAYTQKAQFKAAGIALLFFTLYVVFAKSIISGVIPACTVIFILFYKSNKNIPGLYFIGNISYSLYLIHIPISAFFIRYSSPFINSKSLLFFISVLVSICSAWVCYVVIERPVLKLSKQIGFQNDKINNSINIRTLSA